ncbi:hypothetical protein AJ79_00646 [Helicocarpus griseus UAMH5409]|uniref:Uncharacterized protein n=1 Tax=Helicocarpus griseus UAMH5409 TaxID=1447875 RepID=A0A2B7YCI6_9EURO|nr:hypothetical protein AJ79_00646 [Helicocarpus griseus UAMH5409]
MEHGHGSTGYHCALLFQHWFSSQPIGAPAVDQHVWLKMRRSTVIYILGTSAIICTLVSTIVNGVFAASLNREASSDVLLAYIAVVLTAISSIVLGLLILSFTRGGLRDRRYWKSWKGLGFILLGGILSIALVFAAIALRQCDSQIKGESPARIHRRTRKLYSAWCGIWVVAIIFQLLFYICLAWLSNYEPSMRNDSISYVDSSTASFLQTNVRLLHPTKKRPLVAGQSVASLSHQSSSGTSAISHYNLNRNRSKSTLYPGTLWPSSRAIIHPLQHHRQYDPTPNPQLTHNVKTHKADRFPDRNPLEQESAFDQWDTSSVPREIYDALRQSTLRNANTSPSNRNNTISGNSNNNKPTPRPSSRTSSFTSTSTTIAPSKSHQHQHQHHHHHHQQPPAPISSTTQHEDSILPESPTLAYRTHSNSTSTLPSNFPSASAFHYYHSTSPLPSPKFPTRQRAHSFEDHIHPLFRSSSPGPPPATTRGTVVVASPAAGQTISKTALSRIKSGSFSSLPASSSPLARMEMMRVEMEVRGIGGDGDGDDGDDESRGRARTTDVKEEEWKPLSIPGFVLTADHRGSWKDYGKRRGSKGGVRGKGNG